MPGFEAEALQLVLFDGGPDVARLKKEAARLTLISRSPSTERSYGFDWADFTRWCAEAGRRALPATPASVELYVADCLQRLKLSSIERHLAAIASKHRGAGHASPVDAGVHAVMSGARRERGTKVNSRAALSVVDLRAICWALARLKDERAVRDRALLTFGFAGAMRISEMLALDVADIDFVKKGLLVHLARAKNDQFAKGRVIGVFYAQRVYCCPVRCLRAWLKVRGKFAGPLFPGSGASGRLTREAAGLIVKRRVELAGLDPARYGTHSLRAGFVTTATEKHVPDSLIMQRTGHRSVQTLQKYVRPATVFSSGDALARAL